MMIDDIIDWGLSVGSESVSISLLMQAERFDFGLLILERDQETVETFLDGDIFSTKTSAEANLFVIPKLTKEEREFWFQGLIPIPAPICWYEFIMGETRSGILIETRPDGIWLQRIEYEKATPTQSRKALIDDIWCKEQEDGKTLVMHDDPRVQRRINELILSKPEFMAHNWGSHPGLIMYLTLMLNSQTTELSKSVPNKDANRLRRLRGKLPLKPHTTVTIVPKRFMYEENGTVKTGTHKRLHWRRSHLRVYHRGEPNEFKRVIPRFLVGKRELGEISHDYKVVIAKEKTHGKVYSG